MIYRRFYNVPNVGFRNAFEQFDRLRRQLANVYGDEFGTQRGSFGAGVFPQVNLTEDADKFYVRAELPGIKSEDLEMQATAKNLTLSGERKIEPENDGVRYHRREREAGKFSRIIAMPTQIDPERIEAKLKDGVLTIHVPKADAVKPRQITIN